MRLPFGTFARSLIDGLCSLCSALRLKGKTKACETRPSRSLTMPAHPDSPDPSVVEQLRTVEGCFVGQRGAIHDPDGPLYISLRSLFSYLGAQPNDGETRVELSRLLS